MAVITISRGTMSGGKQLAEMLAERLGYRCVSREIVIKAADDYGAPEEKLFEAVQKSLSIFQKLTFERERYLAYIQASLCEYAKDDNLIYHGHAGHFLLQGISHVLRIRLVAGMRYRIKAAMDQLHFSEKDAAKYIARVDKERAKWTDFLYGCDWRSPELYDIVFNLEDEDLNFVCEMVAHAVKQPQFQATPASVTAMENLVTASRVRAAFARISGIRLDRLTVVADGGTVIVAGRVPSQELRDSLLETALQVPGVDTVKNDVQMDYRRYGVE
jgi:cytidylate kinase